jgi:hypothetical protein
MKVKRVSQTETKKASIRTEPDDFGVSPKKSSTIRKPPVAVKDAKTLAKKGVQIILEQNQMYSGEKEKTRHSKNESERQVPLRPSIRTDRGSQARMSQPVGSSRHVTTEYGSPEPAIGYCCCSTSRANSQCPMVSRCGYNQMQHCIGINPRVSVNTTCSYRSTAQVPIPTCNIASMPNPYMVQPNVYVAPPQPTYQFYYPNSFPVYNPSPIVYSPPYILSPRNGSFVESTAFGGAYNHPQVVYSNEYDEEVIYGRPSYRDRRSFRSSRVHTENDAGASNYAKKSKREKEKEKIMKEIEKAKKLLKELQKEKSTMKSVISTAKSILPTTSIHELAQPKNFKSEIDEMIAKLQTLDIKNKVNSALKRKQPSTKNHESKLPFPELPTTKPSFMIGNLDRFVQDDRQSLGSTSRSKFNFASEIDSISRIKLKPQLQSQQDPSPNTIFDESKFNFHKKPSHVYDEQSRVLGSERFIMIGNNLPVYIETLDPKKDEFVSENQDTRSQETEERYKKLKRTLFFERQDSVTSNPFFNFLFLKFYFVKITFFIGGG